MAFINQQDKKDLMPGIKAVLAKHGVKASFSIRHNSTFVCTLKSGPFVAPDWYQVNEHHLERTYEGQQLQFLQELIAAMKGLDAGSTTDDSMTDYFHRSHYTDIMVGSWCKPYECTNEQYDIQDDLDMLQGRIDDLEREDKMVA